MKPLALAVVTVLSSSIMLTAYAENSTTDRDWLVLVSPFVWGAKVKGDVGIAGFKQTINIPFHDVAKNVDSVFMGNIEVTNRQFGAYIDVVSVDTSDKFHVKGLKVKNSIEQSSYALGGFYRVYEKQLDGNTVFGEPRHLTLDPIIGMRWNYLNAKIYVPQFQYHLSKTARWSSPFVGARVSIDLNERWNFSGLMDFAEFSSRRKTRNLQGYLGYRTYLGQFPTTLRFGYRYLKQDYRSHDFTGNTFKYDIEQSGPVVGLTVRF